MKYEKPSIGIRLFYSEEPIAADTLEEYLKANSIPTDASIASYDLTSMSN